MIKTVIYTCSKCGSNHTELRNNPPHSVSLWNNIVESFKLSSVFQRKTPLAGRFYLVCMDCGHASILMS